MPLPPPPPAEGPVQTDSVIGKVRGRQCAANSRNTGNRCRSLAIPGGTVCRLHGGSLPVVKAKAKERLILQEIANKIVDMPNTSRLIGDLMQVDPGVALLRLVWESASNVEYWKGVVRAIQQQVDQGLMPAKAAEEGQTAINAMERYDNERERLAKVAKMCLDAGIAERQVRLAERQGQVIVQLLVAVLENPELQLTPEQRVKGREIAGNELRLLASGAEGGGAAAEPDD